MMLGTGCALVHDPYRGERLAMAAAIGTR